MSTRGFSCGAQTLKDYLFFHKAKGVIPRENITTFQDIIDEAKFYVQLFPQKTLNLVKVSPCIVKFGADHFVLVNGVSQGIVYYLDNGLPYQLPLDDFYGNFKGLVLSEQIDDPAQILKEDECLKIVGHKKFFKQILAPVLPALTMLIPGIGPLMSAALSAGLSAGIQKLTTGRINPLQVGLSAVGGGLGKAGMMPGITAAKAGAAGTTAGWGGQVWAGGRTLLGMAPSSAGVTATVGGLGTVPVKPTLWQQLTGAAGNVSGTAAGATVNPLTQVATAMDKPVFAGQTAQLGGGFTYTPAGGWTSAKPTSTATPTFGTTPTIAPITATGTTGANVFSNLATGASAFSNLAKYIPSLLTTGVSAGMELPELPDLEANYREVSERVLGGSPLSNLATNRAMEIMQGEPLTKEDEQAILNIFNDRERESLEQVNKQYQVVGRLGSEENQEQLRKTKEYWSTQKAYGLYAARKDAQAVQTQVMQAAWGYDQNQINQMLALADRTGDIEELKWAIRAGDTMGVKSALDKLAQLLWPQTATATV